MSLFAPSRPYADRIVPEDEIRSARKRMHARTRLIPVKAGGDAAPVDPRPCATCGMVYVPQRASARGSKFCSQRCSRSGRIGLRHETSLEAGVAS